MYAIGELILRTLKAKGLSKADLARAMGFRNVPRAIRRLDSAIEHGIVTRELNERIPGVLVIPTDEFQSALNETDRQKQAESKQAAAEREAEERRTFQPHIYILHERSRPSPIFIVAFTGVKRWKHVQLPDNFSALKVDEQLAVARATIARHYADPESTGSPFGKVTGYQLRKTFDHAIEFSTAGQIVEPFAEFLPAGRAVLTVKGRPFPTVK